MPIMRTVIMRTVHAELPSPDEESKPSSSSGNDDRLSVASEVSLPDQIRQAIAAAHIAVEATPLASALAHGTIGVGDYIVLLQELHHLHASLESSLVAAALDQPLIASIYHPEAMDRAGVILRDLAAFTAIPSEQPGQVIQRISTDFASWAVQKPWALLGALYVMEGSRMGSMMLARSLAKAFSRPAESGFGLDYHVQDMAGRPAAWKQFRKTLADLPFTLEQQGDIIQAAIATMNALVDLYASMAVSPQSHHSLTA
mgnify:CR=1 FL=1